MKLYEVKKTARDYKIFLDLDGVMADFGKAVQNLLGQYPDKLDPQEMWPAIINADHFFLNIPKKRDADSLWSHIKGNDVEVLTGLPPAASNGKEDKIKWVQRNISKNIKVHVVPAKDKQNFADEHHILIDDRPKNIDRWKAAGGIGILHKSTAQTVKELKKLGVR